MPSVLSQWLYRSFFGLVCLLTQCALLYSIQPGSPDFATVGSIVSNVEIKFIPTKSLDCALSLHYVCKCLSVNHT